MAGRSDTKASIFEDHSAKLVEILTISNPTFLSLASKLYSARIIGQLEKSIATEKEVQKGPMFLVDQMVLKIKENEKHLETILQVLSELSLLSDFFKRIKKEYADFEAKKACKQPGRLEESDGLIEVFISYKWTDDQKQKKLADNLYVKLKEEGITVFKDDKGGIESGDELSDEISAGIDNCEVFVCILSKEYYKSIWCPKELEYAFRKKKKLFPIRWGDDKIPEKYNFLFGLQFYHNYKPQAVDSEKEFKKCTDSLTNFLQKVRPK